MRHGSLFSGIGGFDLAASWLGWTNTFQVEIDPFATKILAKHFPDTHRHADIKTFQGSKYRGKIDVLSGGFPCQPFSSAGKQQGPSDPRYLWPEMLRVVREVRPRYVVGENVAGFVFTGDGLDRVCRNLEAEGCQTWPIMVPARALGAPHYRDRIWIVAHANSRRRRERMPEGVEQKCISGTELSGRREMHVWERPPPPRTSFCGMADGIPDRVHRLRSLGNAIVPQIAYQIFQTLRDCDRS